MITLAAPDAMLQGTVLQRDLDHVATRFFHCLLHGCRHFLGFALAHADTAIAVTDHGQRGKTQNTTALDHLGHAVDRDHLFAQAILRPFSLALHLRLHSCHVFLRFA